MLLSLKTQDDNLGNTSGFTALNQKKDASNMYSGAQRSCVQYGDVLLHNPISLR